MARVGLRFDVLDTGDEAAVVAHDLRAEVVDLARGHVWAGQRLPEDAVEVGELAIEVVKGAVDLAALVEDGVGVGGSAAAAVVGLHLYVAWGRC